MNFKNRDMFLNSLDMSKNSRVSPTFSLPSYQYMADLFSSTPTSISPTLLYNSQISHHFTHKYFCMCLWDIRVHFFNTSDTAYVTRACTHTHTVIPLSFQISILYIYFVIIVYISLSVHISSVMAIFFKLVYLSFK